MLVGFTTAGMTLSDKYEILTESIGEPIVSKEIFGE